MAVEFLKPRCLAGSGQPDDRYLSLASGKGQCYSERNWGRRFGVCRTDGGTGRIDLSIRGQEQGGVSQKPCNRPKGAPDGEPFLTEC